MNFNCGLILPNHDTCVGMTMCRLVRVPLVCHFGSRALDLQPWHVIPCRWGRGKSARARLLVSHLAFPGFCFRSSDWRPHLALGWQVKAVVCFQEIPRDSPLGEVDQQSAVVLAPSQGLDLRQRRAHTPTARPHQRTFDEEQRPSRGPSMRSWGTSKTSTGAWMMICAQPCWLHWGNPSASGR